MFLRLTFSKVVNLFTPLGIFSQKLIFVGGKINVFRLEMGRRGSPRAHTLGKWSHEPRDHFQIGFGPPDRYF